MHAMDDNAREEDLLSSVTRCAIRSVCQHRTIVAGLKLENVVARADLVRTLARDILALRLALGHGGRPAGEIKHWLVYSRQCGLTA